MTVDFTGHSVVLSGNAAAPLQATPLQQVQALIAALVASSPAALDTLNELAAALGNDAAFATTVTTALAGKAASAHDHSGTYIAKTTLDANSLLGATADDTPLAFPVAASRLFGRKATGPMVDLTPAEALVILGLVETPDTPPSSANAADYEFGATGSSLPSGWGWINQGSTTYAEAKGVGVLDSPTNGGSNSWRLLTRAVPAGSSWLASARLSSVHTVNQYQPALVLRESSSGKLVVLTYFSSDLTYYVDRWTNPTTYSATSASVVALKPQNFMPYYRIRKNSATSWDFEVSPDGAVWIPITSALNVSAFLTPDEIGFGMTPASSRGLVGCHWFRAT